MSRFTEALNKQIANEFAASQQYIAIAVHYDAQTLPQLATHFYRQAVEERNHAMRWCSTCSTQVRPSNS
jgi:bacterioferritin B